jgi:hypothetical protein
MRVTCAIVVAYCCVTCCVTCSTAHLGGASSYKQHNSFDPEVLQLKEKISQFEAKYDRKMSDAKKELTGFKAWYDRDKASFKARYDREKAVAMKERNDMVHKFRILQEIQEKLDKELDKRVKYEKSWYSTSVNAETVFDYAKIGNGMAKPVLFVWYESGKWARSVYRQITRISMELKS